MAGTTRFSSVNATEASGVTVLNGPAVAVGVIGQWSFGSSLINRGAGSWITDGIKPWSLLSGNLAAKFPAGTRVQTVATLSLAMTNAATTAGAGTDSGTFTPTFARYEDTSFPMENLLYPKRYVPWHTGAGVPNPVTVELDLGAAPDVDLFAMLAHEKTTAAQALGAYSSTVYSAVTYGAYGAGVFNDHSLNAPYRDAGVVLAARRNHRFWKVEISNDGPFMLGSIWLGPIGLDMDVSHWPASSFRHELNVARASTGAREQAMFRLGTARRVMRLLFDSIVDTKRDALFALFSNPARWPLLIDPADKMNEVALDGDALEWSSKFTNLQSQPLFLESLR